MPEMRPPGPVISSGISSVPVRRSGRRCAPKRSDAQVSSGTRPRDSFQPDRDTADAPRPYLPEGDDAASSGYAGLRMLESERPSRLFQSLPLLMVAGSAPAAAGDVLSQVNLGVLA